MAEEQTNLGEAKPAANETKSTRVTWLDALKALAIPLVTLILGFVFNASLNSRQERESNIRLYTEMMGRREQADSDLRKDMFKSILDTFMRKDPKLELDEQLNQEVLNLELLAYNFHESLDLAPLFKHVRSRIPQQSTGTPAQVEKRAQLLKRLENVAQQVIMRQLTVLSDSGMVERGDTSLQKIDDLQAYLIYSSDQHLVPDLDPNFKPGDGVSRLCLSMDSSDVKKHFSPFMSTTTRVRHYRQFKLEVLEYDPKWREVRVRLYVSKVLDPAQCQQADLDLAANKEIDSRFWVGLFDFPMIDNTHLTHGERCAVSLSELNPPYTLRAVLSYFPASRASLKDKPYYDDVIHDLVGNQHVSEPEEQ